VHGVVKRVRSRAQSCRTEGRLWTEIRFRSAQAIGQWLSSVLPCFINSEQDISTPSVRHRSYHVTHPMEYLGPALIQCIGRRLYRTLARAFSVQLVMFLFRTLHLLCVMALSAKITGPQCSRRRTWLLLLSFQLINGVAFVPAVGNRLITLSLL